MPSNLTTAEIATAWGVIDDTAASASDGGAASAALLRTITMQANRAYSLGGPMVQLIWPSNYSDTANANDNKLYLFGSSTWTHVTPWPDGVPATRTPGKTTATAKIECLVEQYTGYVSGALQAIDIAVTTQATGNPELYFDTHTAQSTEAYTTTTITGIPINTASEEDRVNVYVRARMNDIALMDTSSGNTGGSNFYDFTVDGVVRDTIHWTGSSGFDVASLVVDGHYIECAGNRHLITGAKNINGAISFRLDNDHLNGLAMAGRTATIYQASRAVIACVSVYEDAIT